MFSSLCLRPTAVKALGHITTRLTVAALVLAGIVLPANAVSINIDYEDDAGEGFNHPTLGTARRTAFEAAAGEWGSRLTGTIPITIQASMDPLEISGSSAVLGSAGPRTINRDFAGAPQSGVWYPAALANQLAGRDIDGAFPEIVARFNSDLDNPAKWSGKPWYYGTDGNPNGNFDFYFVVEHEFGHGLGFLSLLNPDGSFGNGAPIAFDLFKVNGPGSTAKFAKNMTQAERAALEVSNSLYFRGTNANAANGGNNVRLYAPTTYESGSSGSHLDQATFQSTPHRMMCPRYSTSTHDPGAITMGIMKDMGWKTGTTIPLSISITTPANGKSYTAAPTASGKAAGTGLAEVYIGLAKANASGDPTGWYNWTTKTFGTDPNDLDGVLATGTTTWSRTLPSLANGKYLLLAEADTAGGASFVQAESVFTIAPAATQTASGKCLSIIADPNYSTVIRKPLAGVTLTLVRNGATLATTTSKADGTYSFANLTNGNYTINSSTTRPTQPVTTMDPPSRSFTVNGAPVTVGRFALFSIFGTVLAPNSGGGAAVPQANVTVSLVNHNNVVAATRTTDANGRYEFRQQRGATFTIRAAKTGFTFANQSRTLPTVGKTFSPCARVTFTGTRNPTQTTSGNTF